MKGILITRVSHNILATESDTWEKAITNNDIFMKFHQPASPVVQEKGKGWVILIKYCDRDN